MAKPISAQKSQALIDLANHLLDIADTVRNYLKGQDLNGRDNARLFKMELQLRLCASNLVSEAVSALDDPIERAVAQLNQTVDQADKKIAVINVSKEALSIFAPVLNVGVSIASGSALGSVQAVGQLGTQLAGLLSGGGNT